MSPLLNLFLLTLVGLWTSTVCPVHAAAPTLVYPVADQLPRVARVGTPYAWSPWTNTFNVSSPPSSSSTNVSAAALTYSTASTLPNWLTFDNNTAGFFGTPGTADIGTFSLTLVATNGDGSASSDFTLIVTDAPAPSIHYGLGTQISDPTLHEFSSVDILPSKSGVLIHEWYSFSLGFQRDTFRPSYEATVEQQTVYYSARQRGNLALPDWLTFDNQTVTLFGVAPAAGQTVSIVLIGSDKWGYSAIETSMVIEVGTVSLDLGAGVTGFGNITAVAGQKITFKLDTDRVRLNGEKINGTIDESETLMITPDLSEFPWLSYDASSTTLSGAVPGTYVNGTASPLSLPLSLSTTVNSTLSTFTSYIPITIYPSLFNSISFPSATANSTSEFKYDLAPYIRNTSQVASIDASFSPEGNFSSWISLDSESYTLSGHLPNISSQFRVLALSDAQLAVQIEAMDITNNRPSFATLSVDLQGYSTTPAPTSSSPSPTDTSSSTPSSDPNSGGGLSKGAKIALGVVFGLLGLLLLFLLLFCCCRRRKQKKNNNNSNKGEKPRMSTDSFVGMIKSPQAGEKGSRGTLPFVMPRSESAKLQNGETPRLQHMFVHRPSDGANGSPLSLNVGETFPHAPASPPRRMGAMRGILSWGAMSASDQRPKSREDRVPAEIPPLSPISPVPGEIIRQGTPHDAPSDFSHSFASSDSRASWESPDSFHWSSADGQHQKLDVDGRPISGVASIPRPRADFTPRYPRDASPSALAHLVRPPSESHSHQTFSEFHGESSDSHLDSLRGGAHNTSRMSGMSGLSASPAAGSNAASSELAPSGFTHGPSALGRIIGDADHRDESDDEHDDYSDEGSIIEAHRLSMDRQPRLMPSRERFARSPSDEQLLEVRSTPSQEAEAVNHDAFDDAEEEAARRPESSAYAPSQIAADLQGLGYPSEAIYFGSSSSPPSPPSPPTRASHRISSIRAVPSTEFPPQSPPLPQLNVVQQMAANRRSAVSANSVLHDGRYMAQANENFNLHPHINPPPTVNLSRSTWNTTPPSLYRAVARDGSALPKWLHWDAKELELWGIPSLADAGSIIEVQIVERVQKEKRRSHDSSQYTPNEATERVVGSVLIEVIDGVRSPNVDAGAFAPEGYGSPTAV